MESIERRKEFGVTNNCICIQLQLRRTLVRSVILLSLIAHLARYHHTKLNPSLRAERSNLIPIILKVQAPFIISLLYHPMKESSDSYAYRVVTVYSRHRQTSSILNILLHCPNRIHRHHLSQFLLLKVFWSLHAEIFFEIYTFSISVNTIEKYDRGNTFKPQLFIIASIFFQDYII